MDPKKQDLNPELKQIYDRVMNTQVAKPSGAEPLRGGAPTASPQPQTPTIPQPTVAQPVTAPPPQTPPPPQAAPQPISEPKDFVFTGNKIISPQGEIHADTHAADSKKGLSGSIIAVLVVILVIAWGAFWAKIFGLF